MFTVLISNILVAQINNTSFATRLDYLTGTGTSNPQGITAADLDADGNREIIVGNIGNSSVSIFRNTTTSTNITFATKVDYAAINPVNYVKAIDLDNDGKRDLVTASNSGTAFSIYRNTTTTIGSLTFATRQDFTGQSAPANFDTADIDGDNKVDLIFVNYYANSFSVFRNTSTLGTISFATRVDYSCGISPGSITAYDMDNDGKKDIAITLYTISQISIYKNTTTSIGSPTFAFSQSISTPSYPNYINNEDLDNDGKKDLVVSNFYGNNISILKNTNTTVGTIVFQTPQNYTSGTGTSYPEGFAIVDFDNDNKKDIVVTNRNNATISVFKNTSTNGIINSSSLASQVMFSVNSHPSYLGTADLNNDGKSDVFVSNNQASNISVFRNQILANEPTISASNLIFSNNTENSTTLSFTKGNGLRRIVLAKASAITNSTPLDSTGYLAKDTFGIGQQIGSGNFVIYNDTGNSVILKGLALGVTYYFSIFEYNGINGYSNYLTSSIHSGNKQIGTVYYCKNTGNLNTLSTWGTNIDGSGAAPLNFSGSSTIYHVINNSAPTISADWFISGSNTSVIFGDGINAGNFSIPSGLSFGVDSINVRNNYTFTVQGQILTNKASFNINSTVQYVSNTAQNIVPAIYGNLIVSSSNKTLQGNTTVKGVLAMFGNIICNGYTLTLGESITLPGTLNRSSGTIVGNFKRWFTASNNTGNTGLMPIGTLNHYRPIQINFTSSPSNGGSFTASFIEVSSGNSGLPLFDFTTSPIVQLNKTSPDGFWRVTLGDGLLGGTYSCTATGSGFNGISSTSNLRLVRRTIQTGSWSLPGTSTLGTGTNTIPVVSTNGISSLGGDFTIASDSSLNSLPVKFVYFNAESENNKVKLIWQTSQEINNSHFEIERRTNNEWELIGKINGKGNSNITNNYEFFDYEINTSYVNYYRIKQIDFNGNFEYSSIAFTEKKEMLLPFIIYPNPLQDKLTINLNGEVLKEIVVYDLNGKKLITSKNEDDIDISSLPKGLYFINITTHIRSQNYKVVK